MTNIGAGFDAAFGVAVQPADGKVVAAGRTSGGGGKFALARYNADGTLDTSFGGDGKVTTNFTSGDDWANAVVIQTDGKIVAAGRASGAGGKFALARYNTGGSLDTSFGGDGTVITNFTSGDDLIFGVAIQPADGSIVVAGFVDDGPGSKLGLARYHANGTRDTTFDVDGRVTTDLTNGPDGAYGVAIQPADGKIVAAGTADFQKFALARYNTDGSLDTSFSDNGTARPDFTDGSDYARSVTIQPADGKIVAVGSAGDESFALARYDTDGTPDTTFSGNGKVITGFTPGSDFARSVVVQADGRIVAAGTADLSKFAVARYDLDGSLDLTFSGNGKTVTDFTPGADGAYGVAIQPSDGKIVAAGVAGGNNKKFALARYLAA
ncbi:MAG TPA: delta-60 repeat domain-containing protein [Actinomycetota bacterium]|nr:delta-60 repeat domain-containing protein [Actinomycetota bacterium]